MRFTWGLWGESAWGDNGSSVVGLYIATACSPLASSGNDMPDSLPKRDLKVSMTLGGRRGLISDSLSYSALVYFNKSGHIIRSSLGSDISTDKKR